MKVPTHINREYHSSIRGAALVAALLLFIPSLNCETLWESEFQGYVADGASLSVGDLVAVIVNPQTTLTLNTTHVDSQEGKLSFSGGEGSSLLSFLPEGSSSLNKEVEEESSYTLESRIPARIMQRDQNGMLMLEGSRTVKINGKEENLRVSGWCSAESINSQRIVEFNELYNSVLEYTSPGLKPKEIITTEDIKKDLAADETEGVSGGQQAAGTAEPTEGGVPGETEAGGAAEGAGEGEATAASATAPVEQAESGGQAAGEAAAETSADMELSDQKQRDLLLQYFNRFIDTLFESDQ